MLYMEGLEEKNNSKKKGGVVKKGCGGGNSMSMRCCQAEKCNADLHEAKQYHKRHKVCEYHAKAQVVIVAGTRQRFCQQCSRFHELGEFDDTKRSCRRRLAGHNERRRKNCTTTTDQSQAAEGSNRNKASVSGTTQFKGSNTSDHHDKQRIHIPTIQLQDNNNINAANYKNTQIT